MDPDRDRQSFLRTLTHCSHCHCQLWPIGWHTLDQLPTVSNSETWVSQFTMYSTSISRWQAREPMLIKLLLRHMDKFTEIWEKGRGQPVALSTCKCLMLKSVTLWQKTTEHVATWDYCGDTLLGNWIPEITREVQVVCMRRIISLSDKSSSYKELPPCFRCDESRT